mgnify:CR=1 FL=1
MNQAIEQGRGSEWAAINAEFQARRDELVDWVGKINSVLRWIPGVDYVSANGLGLVFGAETGFLIETDPDTVCGPDIAFVRQERIPADLGTAVNIVAMVFGMPRALFPAIAVGLFLLVVVWASDIGAYVAGRLLGGPKLAVVSTDGDVIGHEYRTTDLLLLPGGDRQEGLRDMIAARLGD